MSYHGLTVIDADSHPGTTWPHAARTAIDRRGLSESAKKKILAANAQRLFSRLG